MDVEVRHIVKPSLVFARMDAVYRADLDTFFVLGASVYDDVSHSLFLPDDSKRLNSPSTLEQTLIGNFVAKRRCRSEFDSLSVFLPTAEPSESTTIVLSVCYVLAALGIASMRLASFAVTRLAGRGP
jgi:hypothetical protein